MTEELDGLSSYAMLALCERWLQDARLRSRLRDHDLGIAMRARLQEVYRQLAELRAPHLGFELRQVSDTVNSSRSELDAIAGRLFRALSQRVAEETDPHTQERYRELMNVVFPDGPRSLSALAHRGGDGSALEHGPSDGISTRLRSVPLSTQTLAEAYRVWAMVEEAIEMRRQARTRVPALLDPRSQAYKATHRARKQWVRTVRALFTAVALMPLSEHAQRELVTSLEEAVVELSHRHYGSTLDASFDPVAAGSMPASDPLLDDDTLEFEPDGLDD